MCFNDIDMVYRSNLASDHWLSRDSQEAEEALSSSQPDPHPLTQCVCVCVCVCIHIL